MFGDKDKDKPMFGKIGGAPAVPPEDVKPLDHVKIKNLSVPKNDNNIIYVGEGNPTTQINGTLEATLPDPEVQRSGFYHEKAREIIAQFPSKYKRFVRKGE